MNIISFPNSVLERICIQLQDRDIKALGMTSKKMLKVAIKCLDDRDKELEKLLRLFTQSRHFNINSAKDADVFAIGEVHENDQCLLNQRALMEFLLLRGPVIVLKECLPSMELVLESKAGECAPNPNLHSVGWDDMQVVELMKANYRQIENKIYQIKIMKHFSFKQLVEFDNFVLEKEKELLIKKQDLIKVCLNKKPVHKYSEYYMQLKMELELTEIRIENVGIVMECSKLIKNSFDEELWLYYDELECNQYHNLIEILQRLKAQEVIISYTFPSRTRAMCNTLQKMRGLALQLGLCHPKIFLIAGWAHLEIVKSNALDDRYNLIRFYEELNNHKAVVLLPSEHLSDDHIRRIKNFKDPVHDLAYKVTRIVANLDVGFGKSLYIRGNADHLLNWQKGIEMVNEDAERWTFTTIEDLPPEFSYKVLIDDVHWERGNNHEAKSGQNNVIVPQF